jgi:hypothetical protein
VASCGWPRRPMRHSSGCRSSRWRYRTDAGRGRAREFSVNSRSASALASSTSVPTVTEPVAQSLVGTRVGFMIKKGPTRVSRTMDSSEPVLPRRLLRPVARRGLPGRPCRGAAAASPDPAVDGPGPDGHDRPLRRRGSPQRGRCWTSPRCTRPEDLVALAPALASSWLASSCRAVDFEAYPILIGRCARGWDGAPHDIHSRPGRPVRPRSALRAQPAQDRAERDPPRQMWA